MAARQGLSAQLSQASEDAKRAVLQRAPLKSSWFSNLNTTCTIKSAPPRTPEVLGLLGTKCGWLVKRNEQHIWQTRWCCVVPHTFLYYFDADIGLEGAPSAPPAGMQEALNQAVREGFSGGQTAPRSSLYNVFPSPQPPAGHNEQPKEDEKFNTMQPAGIIDLECYSSIHRSSHNSLILELAGDESVNPDLRSFYFCAANVEESEEWTQALLSMRHSALVDEREAFREVCDGFAQQLQVLHGEMEQAQMQKEEALEETYRVRSLGEEQRRQSLRVIQEALERDSTDQPFGNARRMYRSDLDTVQQQNMGVLPAVQIMSNYLVNLEQMCSSLHGEVQQLREQRRRNNDTDQQQVREMLLKQEEQEEIWSEEKRQLQQQIDNLKQKLENSQKQSKVAHHEHTTQKGNLKSQIKTLNNHKKILKKEVLQSRQKFKEMASQLQELKTYTKSAKLDLDQERKRGELYQRYIQKMESQVRVQQNMMELMSQSVAGSMAGSVWDSSRRDGFDNRDAASYTRDNASLEIGSPYISHNDKTPVRRRSSNGNSSPTKNELKHKELMRKAQAIVSMDDQDEVKSHMSELTEDRTQHFYQKEESSPRVLPSLSERGRLPSYIDAGKMEQQQQPVPKLDTINSASSRSLESSALRDSTTGKRLSVAQRARLEADSRSNRVNIRRGSSGGGSVTSQGSFFTKLENRIVAAIDNSVLGVPDDRLEDALESSEEDGDDDSSSTTPPPPSKSPPKSPERRSDRLKRLEQSRRFSLSPTSKTSPKARTTSSDSDGFSLSPPRKTSNDGRYSSSRRSSSPQSTVVSDVQSNVSELTLGQRQAMQRAKQIEFLKRQGLLKDDTTLKGGAGGGY